MKKKKEGLRCGMKDTITPVRSPLDALVSRSLLMRNGSSWSRLACRNRLANAVSVSALSPSLADDAVLLSGARVDTGTILRVSLVAFGAARIDRPSVAGRAWLVMSISPGGTSLVAVGPFAGERASGAGAVLAAAVAVLASVLVDQGIAVAVPDCAALFVRCGVFAAREKFALVRVVHGVAAATSMLVLVLALDGGGGTCASEQAAPVFFDREAGC